MPPSLCTFALTKNGRNGLPQSLCSFAMTKNGRNGLPQPLHGFAITKRPVILSDVARNDSGVYSIRKGFNSSVNKNGRVKAFIFYFRKAVSRFTVFNTSSLSASCAMRHSQLPEGTPGVFSLSHESSCK